MDFSAKKHICVDAISNIVFDLGGVIINIDYNLTISAFKSLGVTDINAVLQSKLLQKLEVGTVDTVDFCSQLREIVRLPLSNNQIIAAWNAMLLDFPRKRIEFLLNIRSRYRTFLLSNTNQIHIDAFLETFNREFPDLRFDQLFEKVYYSSDMGLSKPGAEIYQKVLDDNNLDASQTLFIDDTERNLAAPQQIGMQVYHLTDGEDVTTFARKAGIY